MTTINGGNGNDWLEGDRNDSDVPHTHPSADTIFGNGGDDTLFGWDMDDQLYGGADNDQLEGGKGADMLDGGDGDDEINLFDNANHRIDLTAGTGQGGEAEGDAYISIESVQLGQGNDTVFGSSADNVVLAFGGDNTVFGYGGNDSLEGGADTDVLDGGDGNDTLGGEGGEDTLTGGIGNDVIYGGGGADRIYGGDGTFDYLGYLFSETGAGVNVNLQTGKGTGGDAEGDRISGIEAIAGTSDFANTLTGDNNRNYLYGGAVDDHLNGGKGDDVLYGLGGADSMNGGDGIDLAYYYTSAAGVTVDLGTGKGKGGEAQGDKLVAIEDLYGSNAGNDKLTGSDVANHLWGWGGDDTLSGAGDADKLDGGAGDDTIDGGDGNDTITADMGADDLTGGGGVDTVDYSIAANFTGTTSGIDVDVVHNKVTDPSGAHDKIDSIEHFIGTALADTFRAAQPLDPQIFDGGAGNDRFFGSTLPLVVLPETLVATFNGGDGNDRFELGAGRIDVDGGKGTDTLDASPFVFASTGEPTAGLVIDESTGDITRSPVSRNEAFTPGSGILGHIANVETVYGTDRSDAIRGNDARNSLFGGGENDVLDGGKGNDILDGGAGDLDIFFDSEGNDTYHDLDGAELRWANSTHAIALDLVAHTADGNGHDVFDATLNKFRGSELGDTMKLREEADTVQGEGGDDIFIVPAGITLNDELFSGEGYDTADYSARTGGDLIISEVEQKDEDGHVVSAEVVAYQGSQASGDHLHGFDRYIGTTNGDVFEQIAWDEYHALDPEHYPVEPDFVVDDTVFEGGGGDDTFFGIYGHDTFDGQGGADTFGSGDVQLSDPTTVNLATGVATRKGYEVVLISVENVLGSGAKDTITGSNGNNELSGNGGNDTIAGGLGRDKMDGGAGIDTVMFAGAGAAVTVDLSGNFAQGEGNDTVTNFENVTGSDFNDTITGNLSDNTLLGGQGDDTLTGLAGKDTLNGGAGSDTADFHRAVAVTVDLGAGTASGEGADKLIGIENAIGSDGNDTIAGSSSLNKLSGGKGDDVLDGKTGLDHLTGGAGADHFVISVRDAIDVIEDFVAADDTIDIAASCLPGNIPTGAIASNQFVSGHSPVANHVKCFLYNIDTGVLSYDSDGAGAGAAVQVCVLTAAPALTFHDIFVI